MLNFEEGMDNLMYMLFMENEEKRYKEQQEQKRASAEAAFSEKFPAGETSGE